ncbi:hypothetical protein E5D57_001814 [Metarhizium anisopliae]|nr:hypothetical protein E5D57_001814 [Metarhizium anisopliae]
MVLTHARTRAGPETQRHTCSRPDAPARGKKDNKRKLQDGRQQITMKRAKLLDGRNKHEQQGVNCSVTYFTSTDYKANPIASWVQNNHWPESFFDRSMDRVLARKKSASSVGSRSRKRSQPGSASSVTTSDQKPREKKSARYRDVRYIEELQDQKSYMMDSEQGISDESKKQIVMLLNSDQEPPQDSSFSDTLFSRTCQSVAGIFRTSRRLVLAKTKPGQDHALNDRL